MDPTPDYFDRDFIADMIDGAESKERLEMIARGIKHEIADGMEWTKNAGSVAMLRKLYRERLKALSDNQANRVDV